MNPIKIIDDIDRYKLTMADANKDGSHVPATPEPVSERDDPIGRLLYLEYNKLVHAEPLETLSAYEFKPWENMNNWEKEPWIKSENSIRAHARKEAFRAILNKIDDYPNVVALENFVASELAKLDQQEKPNQK